MKSVGAPCRLQHIVELHDIPVTSHLPQDLNFPEKTLCVCEALENIGDLFDCDIFSRGQVFSFYHGSIAALTNFLYQNIVITYLVSSFQVGLCDNVTLGFNTTLYMLLRFILCSLILDRLYLILSNLVPLPL